MPDPTLKALLLLAAFVCTTAGLAWLALAMEVHWRQVKGDAPAGRATVLALRVLGGAAVFVSLLLCLRADHGSMAPLVWVMALAGGALLVALTLAWRPGLLAPLVAWARPATGAAASVR